MVGNRLSHLLATLILIVCVLAAQSLRAQEETCLRPGPPRRLIDYRAVFLACVNAAGTSRLATRRMRTNTEALLLTVDPESLATSLEPERCWRCTETSDAEQHGTRFVRALQSPPGGEQATRPLKPLTNAGLTRSEGSSGAFVTGDLCPSRRPLDRAFFTRLAKETAAAPGGGIPVALAVSGLWLMHHAGDLEWLKSRNASGALAITWVNHSYSHPYVKNRPDAQNFLLMKGLDFDHEVYGAERLMIEAGLTPSIFFRFPGLVSDAALIRRLRESHLVALGADVWLALGQSPHPGAIVLVHPNGNEPAGIKIFSRLLDQGRLPKPLRPIGEAPAERQTHADIAAP